MKKFQFTLQSLLNVKVALEKQSKAELAAAEQRIQGFLRELADMETRHQLQIAQYNEKLRRGVQAQDLTAYAIGFRATYEGFARQRKKIEAAEGEKNRIRKKLADVMGERKMLEKLKDKQLAEYNEAAAKENANMIDDFLSNKITSGKTGG